MFKIQSGDLDEAEALLKTFFGFITYGDPVSSEIMGPLISAKQRDSVLAYIEKGKLLEKMGQGIKSQHEASIQVGQHLLNTYVKPKLLK